MKTKLASLFMASLMLAAAFTGCGQKAAEISSSTPSAESQAAEEAKPGDLPISKEKIELSVFYPGDSSFLSYDQNAVTKWLEDQTNIHLNFVDATVENAVDKRNLLLNSGDYPDVFLTGWYDNFTANDIYKYGVDQKVLIPLTDYYKKWGTNISKVFERYPGIEKDMTMSDGNIYGISLPQRPFHGMEQAGKLFINTAWLEKLGLKMPTNTDEFKAVLQAFKDKDPNGNGKQDEIPMSGCQSWNSYPEMMLMNSFAYYTPDNPLYYENDSWTMEVYQPGFKEGVKYVADLVAEGLIDKASWTQNADQLKAQVDVDTPTVGSYNGGHMYIPLNMGSERAKDYDIVAPTLTGPDGYSGVPWSGTVTVTGYNAAITDKCKYPEEAFRWLDFCAGDEASLDIMWGMKGEIWDDVQAGDKNMFDEPAEFHLIRYYNDDDKYIRWGNGFAQNDMNTRFSAPTDIFSKEGAEKRIALSSKSYEPNKVEKSPKFVISQDIGEQRAIIITNVNNYINQNLVEFFVGKKSVDKDWDAFLKGLDGLQVKELVDMTNKAYQEYKAARGE